MFRRWFPRGRDSYDVWIVEEARSISVKPGQTLLQGALEAGVNFPNSCRVGSCGTCKCRLISGRVKMLTDISYTLNGKQRQAGYILACQALLRSDAEISISADTEHVAAVEPKSIAGTICSVTPLTQRIFELRIALEAPLHYRAGQYAEIHIPQLSGGRAYSFAATPGPEGAREVAFHVAPMAGGAFSTWLLGGVRRGHRVSVAGPYGSFGWPDDDGASTLCVAGGSGLGVMLAVLNDAVDRGFHHRAAVLVYGARTQQDLYALEDVETLKARWQGPFSFWPVLSEEPALSSWSGKRGWVADVAELVEFSDASSHALLCGPPPMVDAVVARLASLGLPRHRIIFDKFETRAASQQGALREAVGGIPR